MGIWSFVARCLLYGVVCLLLLIPRAARADDRFAGMDSYIRKAMQKWEVPGLAIAVVKDGEVVLARGYGSCELGKDRKVTEDTVFPIASCTKSFTCLRDRFISLDADSKPGEFTTKPFVLEGSQIRLNADAKRGDIKVEVQDADGKPLSGFIAGLTNRINGDSVRQEVSWRGKNELASLKGRTVKLRFQLHYARLYSFEVLP